MEITRHNYTRYYTVQGTSIADILNGTFIQGPANGLYRTCWISNSYHTVNANTMLDFLRTWSSQYHQHAIFRVSPSLVTPSKALLDIHLQARRWVVFLGVAIILVGSIGGTSLALGFPGDGIIWQATKVVLAFSASALGKVGVGRPDTAVTGGWLPQAGVANGELVGLAAGADVDGGGIRRVPVGSDWWLFWEREVGLALVDDLALVLVGGINNRLLRMD